MRELANVLYVTTRGLSLRAEGDAVKVMSDGGLVGRFPLRNLSGIVVFGGVHVSSALIERCAEDGRTLVWLDSRGRFVGRMEGRIRGNVLLRREQHVASTDPNRTLSIARQMVAAKIQNSRQVLLRGARDTDSDAVEGELRGGAAVLADALERLPDVVTLDEVRGIEGEVARRYFELFPLLVVRDRRHWFEGVRTRRPPRDPINSLLSFVYSLIRIECESALEGVGLDPQVGFLHGLRPGRPSLALDLMEELRFVADRLVLTLVNRRQLDDDDFEVLPGGMVYLTDTGRRTVITAYQQRKEVEVRHRLLDTKVPFGLIPHIQARVLARHLRGDVDHYLPFLYR